MERKEVSGIMVTLVLTSMLTLAFNIRPVKASGTLYIRADGSIDPPTAPISSADNVTYFVTGTISDEIVVERSNITIDGSRHFVQGSGSGNGFYLDSISNVTIRNTNIKSFEHGIQLYSSSGSGISGNNITNNQDGIQLFQSSISTISENNIAENNVCAIGLYYSSNNTISENNITNNQEIMEIVDSSNNTISENNITNNGGHVSPVRLSASSNNNISRNNITNNHGGIVLGEFSNCNTISGNNIIGNNDVGIYLLDSSNNTLRNNDVSNNKYNFAIGGESLLHYIQDIDDSNTVDGRPVCYWANRRDMTVPLDVGWIALINCTHITVRNLNLASNRQGLLLAFTTNSTIAGNSITNNYDGIELCSSSDNIVSGNNMTNNLDGVKLGSSSHNIVSGNNITGNNRDGIQLFKSSSNSVSGNNIIANSVDGIYVEDSSNNTMTRNNVADNYCGIYLYKSLNNNIFHNSFIDNHLLQGFTSPDYVNTWDDGYPSGGNYWSTGAHTDANGDGIADTPYILDATNVDRYPLMSPYWYWNNPGVGDLNRDMKVDIKDIALVAVAFGSYPSHPKWNPCADITGSEYLVPDGKVDIRDIALVAIHFGETYL